jgi:hypothetical protein
MAKSISLVYPTAHEVIESLEQMLSRPNFDAKMAESCSFALQYLSSAHLLSA